MRKKSALPVDSLGFPFTENDLFTYIDDLFTYIDDLFTYIDDLFTYIDDLSTYRYIVFFLITYKA